MAPIRDDIERSLSRRITALLRWLGARTPEPVFVDGTPLGQTVRNIRDCRMRGRIDDTRAAARELAQLAQDRISACLRLSTLPVDKRVDKPSMIA